MMNSNVNIENPNYYQPNQRDISLYYYSQNQRYLYECMSNNYRKNISEIKSAQMKIWQSLIKNYLNNR